MFGKPPPLLLLLLHLPGSALGWLLRNRCCCLWVKPPMVSPLKQTLWLSLWCANAVPTESIMARTTVTSSTEIRLIVIVSPTLSFSGPGPKPRASSLYNSLYKPNNNLNSLNTQGGYRGVRRRYVTARTRTTYATTRSGALRPPERRLWPGVGPTLPARLAAPLWPGCARGRRRGDGLCALARGARTRSALVGNLSALV